MMKKHLLFILIAAAVALPGIVIRLMGIHLDPLSMALVSGTAILGASFLLLWACDAAQSDIPQALALAVVALIAVLPEYAVDMYFTWQAGQHPESEYAHYAIANMTGANRLLIGVAWGVIVAIFYFRCRRQVRLEKDRRTELLFLAMATVYAFVIPIKGSLALYDGFVFMGLYIWYLVLASRRPCVESEAEGPAELLIRLPKAQRRIATLVMFLFSAGAILANAEPFCEGLIGTGKILKINEFLLVQWLAPIASEAPEFIVAIMFAWRGQAGIALGSLLSAKLNQWTLLVGMIPGVFAVSHGSLDHSLPMGSFQMHELFLTAAQSLLAVLLLASMRLSLSGALLLFSLFLGQLIAPGVVEVYPKLGMGLKPELMHPLFSMFYLVAAGAIFLKQPKPMLGLWKGLWISKDTLTPSLESETGLLDSKQPLDEYKACKTCTWRLNSLRTTNPEA